MRSRPSSRARPAGVLRASFVRTVGAPDRVYVKRSNASEGSWSFPTYGDWLPHDLVHLVVESAFDLRRGLWGRVDAGVDPARVNAEANRRGGRDKYVAFGDAVGELLLAEALAGLSWSTCDVTDDDRLRELTASAERLGVALPATATASQLDRARGVLTGLAARWRALVPRGAIDLVFDPAHPARSFEALARP